LFASDGSSSPKNAEEQGFGFQRLTAVIKESSAAIRNEICELSSRHREYSGGGFTPHDDRTLLYALDRHTSSDSPSST